MLAKKFRLTRKQISLIHKKGRRLSAEGISIKCLANRLGFCRFAVNVPTSVSKKATERNRIRRLVYAEIGKNKPFGNLDCLISIYRPMDENLLREKIKKICLNI
jgi:ribonuclease P protein component